LQKKWKKEEKVNKTKPTKNGPLSPNLVGHYSVLEVQTCSEECTSDYIDTSPVSPSVFTMPSEGVPSQGSAADVKPAVLNSLLENPVCNSSKSPEAVCEPLKL